MATPGRLVPRSAFALALQAAALALVLLALAGVAVFDGTARPQLLALVDRSQSVPAAAADEALAREQQRLPGAQWQRLDFGRAPAPAGEAPDASATDLEAALLAALAAHARHPLDGVVVVSDGQATQGDTERALRALHDARLPLRWLSVGREAPPVHLAEVLAPTSVPAGRTLALTVDLAGNAPRPVRVQAVAQGADGRRQEAQAEAAAAGRVTLQFDADRPGPLRLDVALVDAASGRTLETRPDAAAVEVTPRAALLYAQGGAGTLARSLERGGWSVERVPPARLDGLADSLAGYAAVVLDDVAVADAGPRFWQALVRAVREQGTGLLVLGGERSFARGGYRGSELESVLPLLSEPAALDEPVNLLFAVDKSGSMGQATGGVDRFALAQRAVVETARGLGPRDPRGLLVFVVEPRWLLPIGPAGAGMQALARDWAASPQGGTRLGPAVEASIAALQKAPAGRRLLVVVTDGFVDEAPPAGLRARLEEARIESVWLAVGPDADAAAIERLVGPGSGLVLRVQEAAELPLAMRSGFERRRARVERGRIEVEQVQPLPFAPGRLEGWPPVVAHAVTRARPEAAVALQSRRGEPLLAWQAAGRGRVAALAGGLGPWTPQWSAWPAWPALAGGLADWVAGGGAAAAVSVQERAGMLEILADLPADEQDDGAVRLAVTTPARQTLEAAFERIGPRRLRARVPDAGPGLYSLLLAGRRGTERHLLVRPARAEAATWGLNPQIEVWRREGLIDGGPGGTPPAAGGRARAPRTDRALVALALLLFCAGVLVDRLRGRPAWLSSSTRRFRARGPAPGSRPS
ncbi:MAG: VWA domain-containing protein [Rubrivivax sp.]